MLYSSELKDLVQLSRLSLTPWSLEVTFLRQFLTKFKHQHRRSDFYRSLQIATRKIRHTELYRLTDLEKYADNPEAVGFILEQVIDGIRFAMVSIANCIPTFLRQIGTSCLPFTFKCYFPRFLSYFFPLYLPLFFFLCRTHFFHAFVNCLFRQSRTLFCNLSRMFLLLMLASQSYLHTLLLQALSSDFSFIHSFQILLLQSLLIMESIQTVINTPPKKSQATQTIEKTIFIDQDRSPDKLPTVYDLLLRYVFIFISLYLYIFVSMYSGILLRQCTFSLSPM